MIITIIGKDGSGKSTLSHFIAEQLSKDGSFVLIVDTDLHMPTIPVKANVSFRKEQSLGNYIAATGPIDAIPYCGFRHPQNKSVYFAGCVSGDTLVDYTNWEVPALKERQAHYFIEEAAKKFNHIIIEVTPNHSNLFMDAALSAANELVVLTIPDIDGIHFVESLYPILSSAKDIGITGRISCVASKVRQYHDISSFRSYTHRTVDAILPFSEEIEMKAVSRELLSSMNTSAGKQYKTAVADFVRDVLKTAFAEEETSQTETEVNNNGDEPATAMSEPDDDKANPHPSSEKKRLFGKKKKDKRSS